MILLKPSQMKRPRHDVVDGIQYKTDKTTGRKYEKCLTPTSKTRRRREIYERDERRCVKCSKPLRFESGFSDSMHWHHVMLKSQGGGDEMSNGSTLCPSCHLEGEHGHF